MLSKASDRGSAVVPGELAVHRRAHLHAVCRVLAERPAAKPESGRRDRGSRITALAGPPARELPGRGPSSATGAAAPAGPSREPAVTPGQGPMALS